MAIPDLGPGGAQRVLCTLANEWSKRGEAVTIVTFEKADSQSFFPLDDRVAVRRLDAAADAPTRFHGVLANLRRMRLLRAAITKARPNVVITFIDVMNVIVLLSLLGLDLPVVVSERSDPARSGLPRHWRLARRIAYCLAHRIVVQSAGMAAYFGRWQGKRVTSIPNPVNAPTISPERRAAHRSRHRSVVAVGRLSEEKRFDLLLEAFARAVSQFPDWVLTIYGEGPLRKKLEAKRDALQFSGKVRFPGLVTQTAEMYGTADIFVLSSRFEGFPNALCEAMSFGVAPIATACSASIPDIIRNEHNGLIVPNGQVKALADALSRLMGDADLCRQLGENAAKVGQRYTCDAVMDMWERTLER